MDALGKVVEWNDARGFGFVQPQAGGPRLFFHIRDYRQQGRRPESDEWVRYVQATGRNGQPAARQVRRVTPASASARSRSQARHAPPGWNGGWPAWTVLLAYVVVVAWIVAKGLLHDWSVIALLVMSAVTWVAYALDKRAAGLGAQRTPEEVLHLLEFLGGWPGALIAQRSLRHKNRKRSYQQVFWGLVVLHCLAMAGWIWFTATP